MAAKIHTIIPDMLTKQSNRKRKDIFYGGATYNPEHNKIIIGIF
jgi:hypothetical protein